MGERCDHSVLPSTVTADHARVFAHATSPYVLLSVGLVILDANRAYLVAAGADPARPRAAAGGRAVALGPRQVISTGAGTPW